MPSEEVWTDDRRAAFEADRDRIVSLLGREVSAWSPPAPYRNLTIEVALGTPSNVVKAASATTDLIVLGSAGEAHEQEAAEAFDCALFRTGCPVLLVSAVPQVWLDVNFVRLVSELRTGVDALYLTIRHSTRDQSTAPDSDLQRT